MKKYHEDDVLVIVNSGAKDAQDLLKMYVPDANRRLKKGLMELNKLINDVRKVFPNANYYLSMETLNLMLGDSHTRDAERDQQQLIAEYGTLETSGGGDW